MFINNINIRQNIPSIVIYNNKFNNTFIIIIYSSKIINLDMTIDDRI